MGCYSRWALRVLLFRSRRVFGRCGNCPYCSGNDMDLRFARSGGEVAVPPAPARRSGCHRGSRQGTAGLSGEGHTAIYHMDDGYEEQ